MPAAPAKPVAKAAAKPAAKRNTAPANFLDSRDKYLSFVHSTNEKVNIAFYLAKHISRAAPARPFYLLDAGAGEGTVLSTFLTALHKQMRTIPIVAVAKEISIDDICILLSYLPDRFAEHPALVFHITNLTYAEISDPDGADFLHIARELRGDTSHDFGMQLMTMQPLVEKHWAIDEKNGKIAPRQKIVLTLYRKDQKVLLANTLPQNRQNNSPNNLRNAKNNLQSNLPSRFDFIIASQPFRLRRPPAEVARGVLWPLLSMLRRGAKLALVYSSGKDFTRPLLRRLHPNISPYQNCAPQKYLRALAALPAFAAKKFSVKTSLLRYQFINMYAGRSNFSAGNIFSLWKAVTYVGQISAAEEQSAPFNRRREKILRDALQKPGDKSFANHAVLFTNNGKGK